MVCEISQHVLFQYVLLILWFVFVIGIVTSLLGWLCHGVRTLCVAWKGGRDYKKGVLTAREIEYVALIRKKDFNLYNEVMALVQYGNNV